MPIYKDLIYIGPPAGVAPSHAKYGLIIHATASNGDAEGEAIHAKTRPDLTSSHYYVDADSVVQSLNTDAGANHVGSWQGNQRYISWEFCGWPKWSAQTWHQEIDFPAAARQMARDCAHWDIPAKRLSVEGLRDMRRGIGTHLDAGKAWGGTDHTDPGPGFPVAYLIDLIHEELNGMDYKDKLKVSEPFQEIFKDDPGIADGTVSYETALVGGYLHARQGNRRDGEILARVGKVETELAQIKEILSRLASALPPRCYCVGDRVQTSRVSMHRRPPRESLGGLQLFEEGIRTCRPRCGP
jgi:hypothetical protein